MLVGYLAEIAICLVTKIARVAVPQRTSVGKPGDFKQEKSIVFNLEVVVLRASNPA